MHIVVAWFVGNTDLQQNLSEFGIELQYPVRRLIDNPDIALVINLDKMRHGPGYPVTTGAQILTRLIED